MGRLGKRVLFEKRTKNFLHVGIACEARPGQNVQKFFASFFQKRSAFLLVALIAGCMPPMPHPLGRDFSRAAFSGFVLQTTTLPQVEAALGSPLRTSSISGLANQRALIVMPGTPIALTLVNYLFAPYGIALKASVGSSPLKAATLVFFQGRLVGYDVNSSIPGDDNAPIQEDRLGALQKGGTTREEAIALLGPPNGQSVEIGPAIGRKSAVTYSWVHVADGMVRRKVLKLQFDRSGLFVTYTMLDNSFPVGSAPMTIPFEQPSPRPSIPSVEQVHPYQDPGHT